MSCIAKAEDFVIDGRCVARLNFVYDFDFSGSELFHNQIPKILKAMQAILMKSGNENSQMARVQLESVMNNIKEKVLDEVILAFLNDFQYY